MKKLQKYLFLLLVVIILIAVGAYYFKQRSPVFTQDISSQAIDYKIYKNEDLHISFEYPSEWGDPVLTSSLVDLSKCESDGMKTYLPDRYYYTNKITFSKRDKDYLYVGFAKFDQSNPNGCDDGGVVNLVEKRKEFITQQIGIQEEPNGWKSGVSKNEQGNILTYYPDYFNGIGTGIDQIYDMFGSNLLVQAWISYNPYFGTPEQEEVSKYVCNKGQKYGSCGLTQWLREGKTSESLRKDFNSMGHLVNTLRFN